MAIITDKEVIEKNLKASIKRDVEFLIKVVRTNCTAAELCHFIASLNFMYVDEVFVNSEKYQYVLRQNLTNVYKYLISLLACVKDLPTELENVTEKSKIDSMIDIVRGINDKFHAFNSLKTYGSVKQNTDSNEIIINIKEFDNTSFINKLDSYSIRVQENLNIELELKTFRDIIKETQNKFLAYDDILEKGIGINICEIIEILILLKLEFDKRFTNEYDNFSFRQQDIIDSEDYNNHILFTKISIYSLSQLTQLHHKIKEFLRIFTFIPNEFDPFELRYNYIDKKSIIKIHDLYFISFELLLNSLQAGLHYSMLESNEISETYKKRESLLFEEKISKVALKYGFKTIERNLELYEGKRKIGDVDLILKNKYGRKIYVEAKSYSLHSNIQAHNHEEMHKQLSRQRTYWENKVLVRKLHLEHMYKNEGIEYIIVTKKPEILSHFSKLLVLNIQEFEFWLKHNGSSDFASVYNDLYVTEKQIPDKILKEVSPSFRSK